MIGVMPDDPAQPQQNNAAAAPPVMVGTGASGKEVEAGPTPPAEVPALTEVGKEAPLTAEVSGAGVKVQPTTVKLPPQVSQLGVQAVGQASPGPAPAVTLPLTDDQIAQGLHTSISSSLRWLAEWCRRRLKQAHVALKKIHGKIMRVRA